MVLPPCYSLCRYPFSILNFPPPPRWGFYELVQRLRKLAETAHERWLLCTPRQWTIGAYILEDYVSFLFLLLLLPLSPNLSFAVQRPLLRTYRSSALLACAIFLTAFNTALTEIPEHFPARSIFRSAITLQVESDSQLSPSYHFRIKKTTSLSAFSQAYKFRPRVNNGISHPCSSLSFLSI